ncbi:MAG: nicotinate-nucleotide--dimethylbenzimidazole phosphoribosyltransferase [Desulfovibrio sp.]
MEARLQKIIDSVQALNPRWEEEAWKKLDNLTKPPRSLGRLEELVCQIVSVQESHSPAVDPARFYAIAGDHGIAEEGITRYPQEVTRQMVENFIEGGAGINVLVDTLGAELYVVDAGCVGGTFPEHPRLLQYKVAQGTGNFTREPAMDRETVLKALLLGVQLADEAHKDGIKTLGTGEMGVSNTSSSTALYCAMFGLDPLEITGPGGGITPEMVQKKAGLIAKGLATHAETIATGDLLDIFGAIGGLEITTLCGMIIGGAANRQMVCVDGFISTAAYAMAWKLCPVVKEYCVISHASAEPGHKKALEIMNLDPYLDLGMKLGEGSGAAVVHYLLRCAVNCYNDMASFEEAGVDAGGCD